MGHQVKEGAGTLQNVLPLETDSSSGPGRRKTQQEALLSLMWFSGFNEGSRGLHKVASVGSVFGFLTRGLGLETQLSAKDLPGFRRPWALPPAPCPHTKVWQEFTSLILDKGEAEAEGVLVAGVQGQPGQPNDTLYQTPNQSRKQTQNKTKNPNRQQNKTKSQKLEM